MQPSFTPDDVPAGRNGDPSLDGPDYVALVIEWPDDEVTEIPEDEPPLRAMSVGRKIATVVGALVALALATWGLRRLRAAG